MRERYQERGPSLALLLTFVLVAAIVNLAVGGLMQVVVRHGAGARLPGLQGVTRIDLIDERAQAEAEKAREENPVPEALISLVEPMDQQRANDPKYTDAYDRQVEQEQRASRANDPSSARGQRDAPAQVGASALPPGESQAARAPQSARPALEPKPQSPDTASPHDALPPTDSKVAPPNADDGAQPPTAATPDRRSSRDPDKANELASPPGQPNPASEARPQRDARSRVVVPTQSELAASMHEVFGAGGSQQALDGPANAPADLVSTQRHDYASFFNRIRHQIVAHWDPNFAIRDAPAAELGAIYRRTRLTLLRVRLRQDGSVDRVWIDRSSGFDILDEHAVRAVRAAAPFANLPPGLQDARDQKLVFSMEFRFTRGATEAIRITP